MHDDDTSRRIALLAGGYGIGMVLAAGLAESGPTAIMIGRDRFDPFDQIPMMPSRSPISRAPRRSYTPTPKPAGFIVTPKPIGKRKARRLRGRSV